MEEPAFGNFTAKKGNISKDGNSKLENTSFNILVSGLWNQNNATKVYTVYCQHLLDTIQYHRKLTSNFRMVIH